MAPKKKDDKKDEEGAREDVGVFTYLDGAKYDGQYVKKEPNIIRRHGNGVVNDITATYDGQFLDDEISGEGTMTFESGSTYVGTFYHSMFDGRGKYTWPDGSSYEGTWRANQMHGDGTYTDTEGNRWYGKFYNGNGMELIKETV